MVLLTLSNKVNGLVGPFLLRNGLKMRRAVLRGQQHSPIDTPYLDVALLIRYAEKIISLEIHDESARMVSKFKDQSKLDVWVDQTFDGMFGKNADEERLKQASVSEIRIEAMEDTLRPALVFDERWEDVLKWRFNFRLVKWARSEYLIAKYGPDLKEALDAYPEIRSSPQISRGGMKKTMLNLVRGHEISFHTKEQPFITLPSSRTLKSAFQMESWNKEKDTQNARQHMIPIAEKIGGEVVRVDGRLTNYADAPTDADLSDLSMGEILELAGGNVLKCRAFNVLCEEANIYQMWTKEYVSILGDYLLERTRSFDGETVVLDIGAGDGLLMRYVKEYFEMKAGKSPARSRKSIKQPTLHASDDGSWGIFPKADVEKIDANAAMEKYASRSDNLTSDAPTATRKNGEAESKQVIVLCSWMPMGEDWSQTFRDHAVDEYILIGEADNGGCGDNWRTWGNYDFCPQLHEHEGNDETPQSMGEESQLPPRPYEEDGYKRYDMDVLTKHQFSRFDTVASKDGRTVCFRRKR